VTVPTPRLMCSTAAFFARPLREGMRPIAEAGFEHVEVMVTKDPATHEAGPIAAAAREHGLVVGAIHAPFLMMTRRVFGTDPVGKIHRTVHLAEEVGASVVIVHPPYRWQGGYRRWLEERLPGFSARTGVAIAVENMFPVRLPGERHVRFHADQELHAWERNGHVVLDTSHAAVAGLDIDETAARLGPKLAHVHLSNNAGKGWDSHLPVEEGVLPLGAFVRTLSERGFAGNLSLELDIRSHLDDERATRDVLTRQREFCESRLVSPVS
jgi:sugar phosphate isomerase/epimerase